MGIILAVIAASLLFGLLKVLSVSTKVIMKLVWNGLIGLFILVAFNLLGSVFGVTLDLTFVNALIAGVFGIPGVLILLLVK